MHVTGSDAAARVVGDMRSRRGGALTITIGTGCCESTAPFLYEDFWPGPDQEVVGEVGGVPVYAPEYLRTNYPDDDGMVIDVVEGVLAESLSIETELSCRLILRGFGIDLGVEADACPVPSELVPNETVASMATGGPSQVKGELPPELRRLRLR
jgi:uncharacterized protein (DUF779 family)